MKNCFHFQCRCGAKFDIELSKLTDREQILCPNCENSVCKELLDNLKVISKGLSQINKNNLGGTNEIGYHEDPEWYITVKTK